MTPMRELLEHSYEVAQTFYEGLSRKTYLADHIFDFTTYDDSVAELFATKATEVCAAISNGTTHAYIEDEDNYCWYLLMVNMPFFVGRLDWGTSIRGAWWDRKEQALETSGIWRGDEQVIDLAFTFEEWLSFIAAVVEFAQEATAIPNITPNTGGKP